MANYISLLNKSGQSGYTALFSSNKGGESAGTVASSIFSSASQIAALGGESAGTVAGTFGGSFSGGCCSFTAIV